MRSVPSCMQIGLPSPQSHREREMVPLRRRHWIAVACDVHVAPRTVIHRGGVCYIELKIVLRCG